MMLESSYLILGGTGFIGRHLVKYLVDNELASKIRVVDKMLPALSYLNDEHKEALANPKVEFVSANLLLQSGLEKAFQSDIPFDFVINCAGETRHGMAESIYYEGIVTLSTSCASWAESCNVKRYVEISSASLVSKKDKLDSEKASSSEPGTSISNCKRLAEEAIMSIPNLKFTILRPASVYGIGDRNTITPRLIIGAIYRQLDETLQLVWSRDLMMNTVHVHDLCRAICFILDNPKAEGEIYNVVDLGHTTNGLLNDMIAEIFGVTIKYIDNTLTNFFKVDFDSLIEEINERHSKPWAQLCEQHQINNTPLSSYLHKEGLSNKHLKLDGAKLLDLGFMYKYPKITKESVIEILDDYRKRKLFPMN